MWYNTNYTAHVSFIFVLWETQPNMVSPMKIWGLQWKSGVSNEDLRVSNENLGYPMKICGSPIKIWGLQWKSGVSNENLGFPMKISGLQWKSGVYNENLGVTNGNMGVCNENLGVSNENLRIFNKNLGSPMKIWGSPIKIWEFPTRIWFEIRVLSFFNNIDLNLKIVFFVWEKFIRMFRLRNKSTS